MTQCGLFTAGFTTSFKKGFDPRRATGGARPNSGPRPNWLTERCRVLGERAKIAEFWAEVMSGKYMEYTQFESGAVFKIKRSAPLEMRIKASQLLSEWGYIKPASQIELGNTDGSPLQITVTSYSTESKRKEPVHQNKRPTQLRA